MLLLLQLAVVEEQLKESKQKLFVKAEVYKQDYAIYKLQKPMDDIRLQLLHEAGIKAEAQVCSKITSSC